MKTYFGIDVGGTAIKGICADEHGKIIAENSVPTGVEGGGESICANITKLIKMLEDSSKKKAKTVGIGCAGMIASDGSVVFAGNLSLSNFPLAKRVSELTGAKVKVTNDANAAALGEAKFGAGKQYKDSVFLTIGTGIGGGIIIDGKLFEGGKSVGAEVGHMVIVHGGRECTCGRKGCFEAYSSATALIKQTAKAMSENPESAMWKTYTIDTVCGKTAFDYLDSDESAKKVVEDYIYNFACGITNLANIFRPQVVILGGGVSAQGERLIAPLQERLDKKIFGGQGYAPVKIVKASLGNNAGALGAAALFI